MAVGDGAVLRGTDPPVTYRKATEADVAALRRFAMCEAAGAPGPSDGWSPMERYVRDGVSLMADASDGSIQGFVHTGHSHGGGLGRFNLAWCVTAPGRHDVYAVALGDLTQGTLADHPRDPLVTTVREDDELAVMVLSALGYRRRGAEGSGVATMVVDGRGHGLARRAAYLLAARDAAMPSPNREDPGAGLRGS